jgi:hypothetical protein
MNASHLTRFAAFATVFAAAAATAPAALAQADGTPLSRAEVNQQTRAAIMAGHMLPAGELIAVSAPVASTVSREQRKAEVLAVNRTGVLGDYGRNTWYAYNVAPRLALETSTKTRADRKAETMLAIQHKQMLPAGEAI